MKRILMSTVATLLVAATGAWAQPVPAASGQPQPFAAGLPLGVTVQDARTPLSSNVKVFGAIVNAESCAYDVDRKLIVAVNRGANQNEVPNDGFVSLINSDGSVHTARWIGQNRNGLVLNQPFGSDIQNGRLYVADRNGGTADGAPSVSVIRWFDMKTGAPMGEIAVPDSPGFNDIEVAADGTIYASQTGGGPAKLPMRLFKVTADGRASVLVDGDPLSLPNGVGIDNDGNIVVLNMGDDRVLTFSPQGSLIRTERAAQPGSDGLVILPDGVKYVSSVAQGGVSRIRPGRPAELIATGIPSAASMCFDPNRRQLVIPMNPNNALAFVKLE